MEEDLEKKVWWSQLHEDLQELLKESILLLETVGGWKESFHDYAFIVFPAAKAYEGFLKTLFLDLKFITEDDFYGKRFRVGKALNPELKSKFRGRDSVYDKLVAYSNGSNLADTLWQTWKEGRNLLFHWFPNEKNFVTYNESKEIVITILKAMDLAFKGCKIKKEDA
jgi:hypothetical protein